MKATSKVPKIALVETVLVLIAVGLAGFVVWYVQQAKQSAEQTLKQADSSTQSAVTNAPSEDFKVIKGKLPTGWQISNTYDGLVTLTNDDTACFAQATLSNEKQSQTTAELQQQSLKTIEAKGYAVRKVGTTSQSLQSQTGNLQVPASTYRLTLDGKSTFQNFGIVSNDNQLVTTNVSCPTQTGLTAANAALQAITVNRKLTF